jgi:hypothetical protein
VCAQEIIKKVPCLSIALLFLFAVGARAGSDLPQPEVVLREVFAHARAESGGQRYLFTRQTETEELDPSGHVTSRKVLVKTSRAHPVGPADASKWSAGHGVNLGEELLDRYSFALAGRVVLQGRPTLEIKFSPRTPLVHTHHPFDRLLNRAAGTLWVDEQDFELTQGDLRLIEPVNLSILGAIDDLSFRFERVRSSDGTWLTSRTESNFRGRKLLNPVQLHQVTRYSGYTPIPSNRLASQ